VAQPAKRRSGVYARRVQYGLFLGYVFAIAGMILALLMLAIAIVDPRGFAAIKGVALDVTAPVSAGGRGVVRFFGDIGGSLSAYWQAGAQNAALNEELGAARRELVAARAAQAENRRLRQVLGLARQIEDEVALARIVGSSFGTPRRLATLSAGSSSGVEAGQPVRAPEGLIGRVVEVGRWAARVLLVTDGASSVPVRLVRDGTPALAVGRGDGTIELRTLEVGENPFRPGDLLITSGVGGVFPPGVPVAVVARLDGDSAIARPIADPARADFAIVQRAFQPAASAPLDRAAPPVAGPPVAGPPPAPAPTRQRDPRYQPALQSPPPGTPQ